MTLPIAHVPRPSMLALASMLALLVLVADCQSPTTTASPASPRSKLSPPVQREAAPAPPKSIATSPVASPAVSPVVPVLSTPDTPGTSPAGTTNTTLIKRVTPIPIKNLVLDPLPSTATGDTVVALLKWSDTANDSSIGNNWNLCSSRTIFDNTTAALACKHYGYPAGGFRLDDPVALLTEKPYLVSLPLFNCAPNATAFANCTSGDLIRGAACPEMDTIAIKCYGEGSLRLVGGGNDTSGRLQMFWAGAWNNVCSSNIVNETGNAVCGMLGFAGTSSTRVKTSTYDPRSTRYSEPHLWVPYVSCNGGETSFKRCFSDNAPYRLDDGGRKCYSTDADAGLVCSVATTVAKKKKSAAPPTAAAATGALYLVVVLAVLQAVLG